MINRLPDSLIRQSLIEQLAPQQAEQQTIEQPIQEQQQPVRDSAPSYANSLISERSAQESYMRSNLDQQLAISQSPQAPPAGEGAPVDSSDRPLFSIQRELALGSQGEDVKTLQTELNQWLASVGEPALPTTGYFGEQTKAALKLYQESTGIKADGIFGPVTRDNLTLNNDPNFNKLDFNFQQQVRLQMSGYEKDPERRRVLLNSATDPNFVDCNSQRTRQAILNRIDNGPITPEMEQNLKGYLDLRADMAKNSTFQGLSAEMQDRIDMQMEQTFDFPTQAKIHGLATEPGFAKLDTGHQNQAFDAFKNSIRLGGSEAYDGFLNILRNPSFAGMNSDTQTRVLDAAQRNGLDGGAVRDLSSLVTNPQFAAMSPGQQKAALDIYLLMHPGQQIPVG